MLDPAAVVSGSRAQMFAIPVATVSRFEAANANDAWAKASLRLSVIHSVG